ncbi:MAG: gliding motility-associated C-terminal domain-containing protein [Flavobacteriales bacterium]|nr:gliding motility-associated C-terminal domain-containing protein [Flavobacteriales bacterium]
MLRRTFSFLKFSSARLTLFLVAGLWTLSGFGQITFQENLGQWNETVRFMYRTDGAVVYLEKDAISFLQYDPVTWHEWVMHGHHKEQKFLSGKPKKLDCHFFKLRFLNTSLACEPSGYYPGDYSINYFLGNDPGKWVNNAKDYLQVRYNEIYPGVDLIAYTHANGFKYDFILKPGADPSVIRFRYEDVDDAELVGEKLVVTTSLGTFSETLPECYIRYESSEEKFNVPTQYVSYEDGTFGLQPSALPENAQLLVIDPEVVFLTYAGNTADNFGFTATYDNWGHLYSGGITTGADMAFDPNGRYPATTGAFDLTYNGGTSDFSEYGFACDITISKYSVDGSSLVYATYIGGALNEYPHSIVCDEDQNLIIFGTSFSPNFPTTSNAFQKFRNGPQDMICTKLNKDGSALIGSTYIGGSAKDGLNEAVTLNYFYADNHRGEVIVDVEKKIYIATNTYSDDFPLVNAFQSTKAGKQDGIFLHLNEDLSELLWSSYFGGSDDDAFYGVALDSKGKIFLAGGTKSRDLPATAGTLGPSYKGGISDGFIAVIDPVTETLERTSYFGTNEYEQIFSIDVDPFDQVYIVGHSLGSIKVIGDVHSESNSGQFITKMDPELKNIEFSTVFGTGDGAPDITINAFLVDECQKIFVSGWGGKTSGKSFSSTRNLPITPDAYQKTTDGSDFYLYVLSKGAKELLYATYFGGTRTNDHVDGGTSRFDKKGFIYQSICGSCPEPGSNETRISDFLTTPNAFSRKNLSPRCSNVAFKLEFGNLNRAPRMADQLYRVKANDTLQFDYNIYDPDEDSIYLFLTPDVKLKDNLLNFRSRLSGHGSMKIPFTVLPDCDDVGDTLEINVYSWDQGCPLSLDSQTTIRIVVEPPPVVDPPESVCLVFGENNEVRLSWDAIPENPQFKTMYLYRTDPTGQTEELFRTNSYRGGSYTDRNLQSPKQRNYTYYMMVENLCGELGPQSLLVSTTKEFESPISGTYIEVATVTDDDKVLVRWLRSREADFGSYDVYKRVNNPKEAFRYYRTLEGVNDTFFVDDNVKVNEESYCYQIVVNDNCGHVSAASNYACTILLEGRSLPFKHNIYWNPYEIWQGDVSHYDVFRCVDTGSLAYLTTTDPFNLSLFDSSLDYDWGGYWYRVRGTEGPGSLNAQSWSNRIYLIQPPLLHVPNAFTPNGDNRNEDWGIVPVFVKEYHVQVYTRWGEKVYDSREKKINWTGYYQDKLFPNSVYIYTITFTGWDRSIHHRRGTVTVIK